jgi:hypothetical protein
MTSYDVLLEVFGRLPEFGVKYLAIGVLAAFICVVLALILDAALDLWEQWIEQDWDDHANR